MKSLFNKLNKSEIFVLFFLILFSSFLISGYKLNPDPNPVPQAYGCSQIPTIPAGFAPNGQTIGNVFPAPAHVVTTGGNFNLTSSTQIYFNGSSDVGAVAAYLSSKLHPSTLFPLPVVAANTPPKTNGSIYLTTEGADPTLGQEGYELVVTNNNVSLTAFTPEGLFRGVQTIRQLLPADIDKQSYVGKSWTMQAATIVDYPRYEYRGMMWDAARSIYVPFYDLNHMERLIDVLAEYKINCLHIHLTDNEGWRIEMNKYQGLAGGYPTTGFYTQAQYKQLVAYAAENYITIIPEIDMPAHMRFACHRAPITCNDSLMTPSNASYAFIDDVLQEMSSLTPGGFLHIGGDEYIAYNGSFTDMITLGNYLQKAVNNLRKTMISWNDLSPVNLTPPSAMEYWEMVDAGSFYKDISKGVKLILGPACPQNNAYISGFPSCGQLDTYNWNPQTYLPVPSSSILGVEGVLWTDWHSPTGFNIFPNMLGIAETGWSPQSKKIPASSDQMIRVHELDPYL